jgi:two-component system cell cycle response regulator
MEQDDDRKRALRTMKTYSGSSNPPAMMKATRAVLTVQSGPEAGRVVALSQSKPTTIGRTDSCTIALDDARLSRVHVKITYVGGTWMLTDEGSTNGTFVNGVRVEKYSTLDDGSRLLLGGSVSLRFTFVTEEEEQALAKVYDAAMRDGLTGIFNRKALDERLVAEWAFAARHVAPLSFVLLDVDGFKSINDTHGHLAGDAVIREIAARLARAVRTEDVLGRYGGEEFVVVARDIALDRAAQLAERLRRTIGDSPIAFDAQQLSVTASFGVASMACCGESKDLRTLIEIADSRLYAAKRAGRNRVVSTGGILARRQDASEARRPASGGSGDETPPPTKKA